MNDVYAQDHLNGGSSFYHVLGSSFDLVLCMEINRCSSLHAVLVFSGMTIDNDN